MNFELIQWAEAHPVVTWFIGSLLFMMLSGFGWIIWDNYFKTSDTHQEGKMNVGGDVNLEDGDIVQGDKHE